MHSSSSKMSTVNNHDYWISLGADSSDETIHCHWECGLASEDNEYIKSLESPTDESESRKRYDAMTESVGEGKAAYIEEIKRNKTAKSSSNSVLFKVSTLFVFSIIFSFHVLA